VSHTDRPQRRMVMRITTVVSALAVVLLLPTQTAAHAADGHPARIHDGTCEATDRVADHLTGVGATISLAGTPLPEPTTVGTAPSAAIEVSVTTIPETLEHLVNDPHAIVIYESDEAMEHVIACGNVGGVRLAQGDLVTWLAAQQASGANGVAILHDEGGTATTVTIYVDEQSEAPGAPDTTPSR
jgi:hypothetical protein